MSLAVEALARIQPDSLKEMLLPLLSNQSPGIRSRAIRLLYRWYPDEAPRHLADMLNSETVDDRRAALANAFFLPFDTIKLEILRFIIKENSPVLLLQAGNLLIVNPDLEVATVTASIAISAGAEKAPVIRQILASQVEFLVRAGIVPPPAEQQTAALLATARQKLQNRQVQGTEPDEQARKLREFCAADAQGALSSLKKSFSTRLSEPVLLAATEHIAILEPEYLRPFLPELLRSKNLGIQVAALTALTRISPAQAEKLLEQYVYSADPQRRKTGFNVLSLMEKAFALPLMLRTFARETETTLLDFFCQLLPKPLDATDISTLIRESLLFPESHAQRAPYLEKLCSHYQVNLTAISEKCRQSHAFMLENVMVSRAEAETTAAPVATGGTHAPAMTSMPAMPATPDADDDHNEVLVAEIAGLSVIDRFTRVRALTGSSNITFVAAELLLNNEKNAFTRFMLEAYLRRQTLSATPQFSPVSLLQKNLARPQPDCIEVAASLAALPDRPARLAAPLLQNRKWYAWKPEMLPLVLDFIGRTGLTVFSAPVAALIKDAQPEIRFCAIHCLERINPEELGAMLPELLNDHSPEIVAMAASLTNRINARLVSTINPLPAGKTSRSDNYRESWFGKFLQSTTSGQRYAMAGTLFAILAMTFIQTPVEPPVVKAPTRVNKSVKPLQRFATLVKAPEAGEERVVFGRVVTVRADSLTIHSPVLQRRILIRSSKLPARKENDHFAGRVKINGIGNDTVDATLVENSDR